MKLAAGLHVELLHLLATRKVPEGGFKRSRVFSIVGGAYNALCRECPVEDHVVRSHRPRFESGVVRARALSHR